MKDGTIEVDSKTYRPVKAERGKCCEVCDLRQASCGWLCTQFEENEYEYVAMKLIDKS